MKLTILSDIHDNVWNLQKVLDSPDVQKTGALLCCGDLCAPFILRLLGQGYPNPIHIVLGNNDGDVASFIRVAATFEEYLALSEDCNYRIHYRDGQVISFLEIDEQTNAIMGEASVKHELIVARMISLLSETLSKIWASTYKHLFSSKALNARQLPPPPQRL